MANQLALLTKKAIRTIQAGNSPQFTEETWALLMAEAIKSFNMGLEDRIDVEVKRAAVELRSKVIAMVGEHAHNIVAYVVTAQGTRRPIDTWAQASSIYTMAMSNLSDQKALFEAHKKLQEISKTPGLDPETAKNIGGLAAELQERASAATSTSGGGAIGQGGMSQAGMPTGLTIQGKRAYNRPRKSCPKCGSGNFQDVGAKPTPASGKHWDEAKTESVSYKCKDCGHAMTQGQARASKA